jgi:4'-phosphopantetheinyl transferase
VGVDAEDVERPGDRDRLAARRFTPEENAALARLPPADRRRRFFEYWTLKEAYVKARGTGLTIPLAHVAFRIVDGEPVRLMATPHLDDDPARWHLALLRPTDRHVVAVALERGGAGVPEIRSRRCVPLAGAQPREAP